MVAARIHNDASLKCMFERYDGDDDCQAAVAANALANGVSANAVRAALVAAGGDAATLVERWEAWNHHLLRNQHADPNSMLALLTRLVEDE